MNKISAFAAIVASFITTPQSATAFPSGAGCCDAGPGVLGPHGGGDNGSIQDGNYEVLLNDEPPADDLSFSVCRGETNTFTIKTAALDDNFYVGFRARIESTEAFAISGGDESDARLMETGDNTCFVPNAQCPEGVSGITHTDRGSKTEVEDMELTLDDEVGTFELEVTIVKAVNEWYFTTYTVEVEECGNDNEVEEDEPEEEEEEEGIVEGEEGGDIDEEEEEEGEEEDEEEGEEGGDIDEEEQEEGEDEEEDEEEEPADVQAPEQEAAIEEEEQEDTEESDPSIEEDEFEQGEEDESEEESEDFVGEGQPSSTSSDEDEGDECDDCPPGHKPWGDRWGGCYCRWCNYSCPKHSSRKWGRECYDNFDDCQCHQGYDKWNGQCVKRSSSSYNYYGKSKNNGGYHHHKKSGGY